MDREEVLQWVRKKYGTEPDYPWKDDNAVLRHGENNKWYGLIMEVRRDRLGLPGEESVDVLNVKCDPVLISSLQSKEGFHPAYHMNKEKWISIRLDGSAGEEDIKNLIAISYELTSAAKNKKTGQKSVQKRKNEV